MVLPLTTSHPRPINQNCSLMQDQKTWWYLLPRLKITKYPSFNDSSKNLSDENSRRASLMSNARFDPDRSANAPNEYSRKASVTQNARADLDRTSNASNEYSKKASVTQNARVDPEKTLNAPAENGRAPLTINVRSSPEKASNEQMSIKLEGDHPKSGDFLRLNSDNDRAEEALSYSSNAILNQSTNLGSLLERETVETPTVDDLQNAEDDEQSEDKLDFELLSSKASLLKQRTPADVSIPGNQKVIRKLKSLVSPQKKGDPQLSLDYSMVAKKTLSHSITALPEDALERFEREDYEAARVLGVDESIKNFLVSENPSAHEYSVPLTKLVGLNDMSRPFYFAFEGQPTEYGRPTTIRV